MVATTAKAAFIAIWISPHRFLAVLRWTRVVNARRQRRSARTIAIRGPRSCSSSCLAPPAARADACSVLVLRGPGLIPASTRFAVRPRPPHRRKALLSGGPEGLAAAHREAAALRRLSPAQEIAILTSSATFFSTAGLHFFSAYDTGHTSPSSRFAVSWKPRVE